MVEKVEKEIKRRYVYKEGELKAMVGIKGRITGVGLWCGLSPKQRDQNVSPDSQEWFIETSEGDKIE